MTEYAKIILDMINASDAHMTAERIFFELKKIRPKVVQATVYNNLNYLYGKELIRKVSSEGFADRYDKIIKHDHMICRRCGKIKDVQLEDLTESLKRQLKENFAGYDLKIYFVCDECKARKEEEQTV